MDSERLPAGGADERPTMRLARLIASAGAAEDRLRSLLDGLPAEGAARWVRLVNASAEAAELKSIREEMRSLVGESVPGWQRLVERLDAEMGAVDSWPPRCEGRRVDAWTFFTGEMLDQRLFEAGEHRLREVLILTCDDGTETEAILPIGEYRRLLALDAPGPSDGAIGEIEARVRRVAAIARGEIDCPSNDATAHAEEDDLHRDALRRIADGAADAPAVARAALATAEIPFSRWYE